MKDLTIDKLQVRVYDTRIQMGEAAARAVTEQITRLLNTKPVVNIIFAAAPSQNEFLATLRTHNAIDWTRINAFHMDEYVGLAETAPQAFGNFLKTRLFDALPFRSVHYLNGNADDIAAECERYAALLKSMPPDIVCMGIGENTHIAFNDPHVANFKDADDVKVVDLDHDCRQQQVNDGCFVTLQQVPTHALTLTVPAMMRAPLIFCIVPGDKKANAIQHTLYDPISEQHPSTIVRTHPHAVLYIDKASAANLRPEHKKISGL